MKTFYYVNGKKVDAGTYLEAGVTDSHNKKMAKKAKKYYEILMTASARQRE